jgi:CBS domain-containing protein
MTMLENLLVRDWMSRDVVTISKSASLPEAHKLMDAYHIRRLPVMDGEKLVGIITRGDVRGAEASDATTLSVWELNYLLSQLSVERVMTGEVITVNADTTIADAAKVMLTNRIAGLPVIENGKLVGIITESDVFRMVVETWEWKPVRV